MSSLFKVHSFLSENRDVAFHLFQIAQKWFCTQNLHMGLSFQRKKTVWKSVSWFLRYKANIKGPFFLRRAVCISSDKTSVKTFLTLKAEMFHTLSEGVLN